MAAAGVVAVDDGLIGLGGLAGGNILIDGGIGNPHVLLVGLALKQAGRGGFGDDGLGGIQIPQELENLRGGEIGLHARFPHLGHHAFDGTW